MKKKLNFKRCIVVDFIVNNALISLAGALALLYCCVCAFFKMSPTFNVPVKLQPWGELTNNISISVIAAVIFYIVQVYLPNRKRDRVLREVMKKHCKEVLLKECKMLKVRTDAIRNGEHSEQEIIAAVDVSCQKVNSALNKMLENYMSVLPTELISAISAVISDDMLYEITLRASGSLVNRSLEKIVQDDFLYNLLWTRIETIRAEVEKMQLPCVNQGATAKIAAAPSYKNLHLQR